MRLQVTLGTMENLEEQIRESNNNYDLDAVRRAYEFAKKAHDGQMRRSGQPYIIPVSYTHLAASNGKRKTYFS